MAANADLFAPPTEDELKASAGAGAAKTSPDLFAPPTADELKAIAQPSFGDTVKDVLFGGPKPEPETAPSGPQRSIPEKLEDLVGLRGKQKPLNFEEMSPEDQAKYETYKANLPAGLAGAAMTMLPTPASAPAAVAMMGAGGAATGALEPADDSGERIRNAGVGALTGLGLGAAGELVGGAASLAGKGLAKVGPKLGEMITGVPKDEIATYATRAPDIKQMMAEADQSVPQAADNVREGYQQAILKKKAQLNQQIQQAIDNSPKKASASIQPIIDELSAQRDKLNPIFDSDAINSINALIAKVKQGAAPEGGPMEGMTNANYMNAIKGFLQGRAGPSYAENGQMFQTSPYAARAAKAGAAKARGILNEMEPDIADANNQLAALHDIDDDLNQNLIQPGKSDSALMAAGAGTNQRNEELLQKLGKLTDQDMVTPAQNLAAARTFGAPSWSPKSFNGARAAHMMVGGALGGLAADKMHMPWYEGMALGGLLASPAALKIAIDSGRLPASALKAVAPDVMNVIQRSTPMIAGNEVAEDNEAQKPEAPEPQVNPQLMQMIRKNPGMIDSLSDEKLKNALRQQLERNPAGDGNEPLMSPDAAKHQYLQGN